MPSHMSEIAPEYRPSGSWVYRAETDQVIATSLIVIQPTPDPLAFGGEVNTHVPNRGPLSPELRVRQLPQSGLAQTVSTGSITCCNKRRGRSIEIPVVPIRGP